MRSRHFMVWIPALAMILACGVVAAAPGDDQGWEFTSDTAFTDLHGQMVSGVRCGTVDFGPEDLPRAPYDLQAWIKEYGSRADKAATVIPVAFHVLTYYSNRDEGLVGYVPQSMIDDQIAVLNAAYGWTGFSFSLYSVDYTENKQWAGMRPGSGAEAECKAALAVDPAHTLNVYTAIPSGGLLGWSYFPWSFAEDNFMHGSVIHYGTLPGGYADPYNEGDTATHEIGHYVGLYHTFQGGCTEPNDYCADTPQEQTATFRCPIGQDSCPLDPGLDPIENFMDYTDDYCMIEFTPDQAARMLWAMTTYRPSMTSVKALDFGPKVSVALSGITGISPNPCNPKTDVSFFLGEEAAVRLSVYDLKGRLVRTLVDGILPRGEHAAAFDGAGLPSAVYFMVLDAGGRRFTEKLILLK